MKPVRTPEAARQRLTSLIQKEADATGTPFNRVKNLFLFEALAVRLAKRFGDNFVVKGGFALELRSSRARSTLDLDARGTGDADQFVEAAKTAAAKDHGDFVSFELRPGADEDIDGDGAVYGGKRLVADAKIGGKLFGSVRLDVAFADKLTQPPELVALRRLEAFGIAESVLVYPAAAHLAEKLHAYTLPRPGLNSRVKDLPDVALLATVGRHGARELREAIQATFAHRARQPVPASLPPPPPEWEAEYATMAVENNLPWATLDELFQRASAFIDPVLRDADGVWSPETWTWGREEQSASGQPSKPA